MFYLFFTTPAEKDSRKPKRAQHKMPSRSQVIITWCLILIWVVLISFGAVSTLNPDWLKELAHLGVKNESQDCKNFGDDFLIRNNFKRAIAQYQKALEIKPDYADAMVNMAIAYSRIGNEAKGIQLLKKALRIKDNDKGVIYYTLAEILEKQGKIDESIRCYRKALGTKVEEFLIYRKIGSLYFSVKEYDEAKKAFEMSLALQTDLSLSYKTMLKGSLSSYADDSLHLQIIEKQLTDDITSEYLADYDLQIIRHELQNDPEIAKTHNHLGFINTAQGDITKAIEHFQSSLQIWPGNRDAIENLKHLQKQLSNEKQS